jgi:hypothetical protein
VYPTVAHRALADVITTVGVFEKLLEPIGGWNLPLCDAMLAQGGNMGLLPANPRESLLPLELEEALEMRRPVLMEYLDARQQRTNRVIEPRHVRRVSGELILVAHCHLRDAQRTFKLDRIVQLKRIDVQTMAEARPTLVACEAEEETIASAPATSPDAVVVVEDDSHAQSPPVPPANFEAGPASPSDPCYHSSMLATDVETEILKRVIRPDEGDVGPEAARALLKLSFTESDHARMAVLSQKAQAGTLDQTERDELEAYINVSRFIALVQSKARTSLKNYGLNSPSAA